ncbi:hypothetical protein PCC82_00915 [Agrobacterium deltaense]
MSTPSEMPSVKKAHCSKCDGDRNCATVGYFKDSGNEEEYYYWIKEWSILRCLGCDNVFAQTISSNSEDYTDDYGPDGETTTEYHETVAYWPALSKRRAPEWIDEIPTNSETGTLHTAIAEVYGALNNDLKILAAIGMRTVFDVAATSIGIDSSLPFVKKLRELVDRNHIRESELSSLEIVVEAGSASVHRGWEPRPQELTVMMDVLEEFLFGAFIVPLRKKRAEERIKGVKVPKRLHPRKFRGALNIIGE